MTIGVLSIYGAIKVEGIQKRILALAAVGTISYLTTVYRNLGLLYEYSTQLKEEARISSGHCKWMQKYIQSVQTFRVDVGEYYFVQKDTFLTIWDTILNGIITLLLS